MEKSEVVIALEGEALYEFEAKVSHRFLGSAYFVNKSPQNAIYRFNDLDWNLNSTNIEVIDNLIDDMVEQGKKVAFVQLDNKTKKSFIKGDPDYFNIHVEQKMEFKGVDVNPGFMINIQEDFIGFFDDYAIANPDVKDIMVQKEEGIFYIPESHEDNPQLNKFMSFIENQKEGFFSASLLNGKLESKGTQLVDVSIYTSIINDYEGKSLDIFNVDRKIIDAIEGEWDSTLVIDDVNATINSQGRTLLMHAARSGNTEAYNDLITKGANMQDKDIHGVSVLYEALMGENKSLIKKIIPEIDLNDHFYVDLLVEVDIIEAFIENGFDINQQNKNGNTLAMSRITSPYIIEVLLKHEGHDFTLENDKGQSFDFFMENVEFKNKRVINQLYENYQLQSLLEEESQMTP